MKEYSGWKKLDKVQIVYSINNTTEFNGKKYPKAYIVEAGNKKSLESAIKWAKGYYPKDSTEPEVVETENKDFDFQIISAADSSWSQGGKLSFWMCIMGKEGVTPFAVGINSDLLCDLILETTMYNGATKEKVFFARRSSQLGVLHENMPSYQKLLADEEIKKNINKGKTTKWQTGYRYNTLTYSDIMFGYFNKIVEISSKGYDYNNQKYTLDFNAPNRPVYYSPYKECDFAGLIKDVFDSIQYRLNETKCPARQQGEKVFDAGKDYYEQIGKILLDDTTINHKIDRFFIPNRIAAAFSIFKYNPDATIEILKSCLAIYNEIVSNIKNGVVLDSIGNKEYYERNLDRYTVNEILYLSRDMTLYVEYNGTREVYLGYDKLLPRLIEIATLEKENIQHDI